MAAVVRPAASYGSRGPGSRGIPQSYARDLAPARCGFRSSDRTPQGGDTLLSLHTPLCGTPRIA